MTRCIIVDDEPLAREVLQDYIREHPELRLLKACRNALEAFEIINEHETDLIFLDIQMPGLTGISFIKSLKDPPAVIFVTAYPEHAAESYDLNAVDYLLKPVTSDRFKVAVEKYLKQHIEQGPKKDYAYFKVNGRMIKILHKDIIFAQSIKDYVIINTANERFVTHMTMKYLNDLLPANLFKRVHRSFLVGTAHVTAIGRNGIELGTHRIPIGESYKRAVLEIGKM
ncbi:response regulator transcription factor [Daejeonella sp.]|uniref:LytR/AlgR family response regulator transcription factor n=1 Tax=Daejeonella sp. TaxID=2805397 RepID=UPI0030C5EAC6